MSLDAFKSKLEKATPASTSVEGYKKNSISIYLPTEYKLSNQQWAERFEIFSKQPKIKPAFAVEKYLNDIFPATTGEASVGVTDVRLENGLYVADLSFLKTKRGQAMLVVFTNEQLMPVAVCDPLDDGLGNIIHLSLTYVA